jgi:acyl-CoA synthetase (AMP-forming)/AMP-acid ligase II
MFLFMMYYDLSGNIHHANELTFQELIKVNALQVAPAELEAALLENENVADAAVVGITL